jgi:leader peptidase (prepilin peptidase)/N-methyltransferase
LAETVPGWFVSVMAGALGLALGSFLNVLSIRWPQDRSVVAPGSACPECDTPIGWRDNIPVVSWLLLGGRCRACAARISLQYPLVELTTALVWAGLFSVHGPSVEALRGSVFLTILFGIALSDARFYIIPDQFSLGGTLLGLGMSFLPGAQLPWTRALLGAAVGFGGMWLIAVGGTWLVEVIRPGRLEEAGVDRALGGGDVKMMGLVGAFVGAWGVAMTVFFGSLFALVVFGPISYFTRRLIPLGIFLAAGAALSYGWGDQVIDWYRTQILGY